MTNSENAGHVLVPVALGYSTFCLLAENVAPRNRRIDSLSIPASFKIETAVYRGNIFKPTS
jgi:hypothetical protein